MADVSPGYLGRSSACPVRGALFRSSACPVRGALFRNGCSSMARAPTDLAYVAGDDVTGRGDRDIWGLSSPAGVQVLAYRYAIFWRSGTFGGRRG